MENTKKNGRLVAIVDGMLRKGLIDKVSDVAITWIKT